MAYIKSLPTLTGTGLTKVRLPEDVFHTSGFFARTLGMRANVTRPDSQYNGNTGGQGGFIVTGSYDDMSANLSAYSNLNGTYLPTPPGGCVSGGGIGCDNVIGVNLHPGTATGTGNCLETGAGMYANYGSSGPATPVYWVGDFCNTGQNVYEGFPIQFLMDATFSQNYIVNLGDGVPRITVEVMQPITDPNTNDWYAFLYNYSTKSWYQAYENTGNFLYSYEGQHSQHPYIGWSLDEFHFNSNAPTDCPTVPTFSETQIQVADESSGNDKNNFWRGLNFSDYYTSNQGACIGNDGSPTGAMYDLATFTDQWNDPAWQMNDPKAGPSPTPRPTPTPHCIGDPRQCGLSKTDGAGM